MTLLVVLVSAVKMMAVRVGVMVAFTLSFSPPFSMTITVSEPAVLTTPVAESVRVPHTWYSVRDAVVVLYTPLVGIEPGSVQLTPGLLPPHFLVGMLMAIGA